MLYWDKIVLMVGPFGDWIKFSYEGPIFLISEVDGVRIMSADKCEMLQRVPGKAQQNNRLDTNINPCYI